jgi:hypothetical protein
MSEPKQRKQRNNNLYTNNISYFRQDGEEGDRTYFATEDEAVAMLNGPIAKACFNGGRVNGVVWTRSNEGKSRNPSIDHWRKYRCPFSKSSDACPGECRISKSKQNGMYYIQFADVQHIHTTGELKRGLSIAVKTTRRGRQKIFLVWCRFQRHLEAERNKVKLRHFRLVKRKRCTPVICRLESMQTLMAPW